MASPEPAHRALAALAVAALGVTAPARPAAAQGPCTLQLSAAPARVAAGAPRAARLRIEGAAGQGLGAEPPLVSASLGRLDPPSAVGGGWEADWHAPPEGPPQVAVLSAASPDGAACGFLPVPLDGVGDALVRTRAGASVQVRIAERTFGPAVADAAGLALVPVEVPPGVDAAYHGTRRIPLDVPPTPHVGLLFGAATAPADRATVVPVLVFAVTPEGRPREGPPPQIGASSGTVAQPEPAGPGAWRVAWRLPPGAAGAATVTAVLPGDPQVQASLARVAGPPASARVALDRPRAMAGQRPVTVVVSLADAAGNASDADLQARVDAGEVGPPERLEAGRYRLAWTPPARLEGRRDAELTVRAGAATASARLGLVPGGPARLALSAAATAVTADGKQGVELAATVTDAHGNPVDEPPARRVAGAGEVGPPRQAGPGRYAMTYRPRPAAAPGEDEVLVELPPLSARVGLRLRPPTSALTLTASAGAALGQGAWLGLQAGAEASTWRWLGGQEVGLAAAVAFTRLRDETPATLGAGTVPFAGEVRSLALLASAGWRRAAGRRLSVRVTAGGGLARVESLVSAGGGPLLPEASWVPAASGAAALGLPLGPGRVFLEARATWLGDAGLASLQGSPSPISLSLGYERDVL